MALWVPWTGSRLGREDGLREKGGGIISIDGAVRHLVQLIGFVPSFEHGEA